MKKFTTFTNYLFLFFGVAIFGLTSCGDDPIITNEIPPSVTLTSDVATIAPGGTVTFSVSGVKGDGDMSLLTLAVDGNNVDLADITSTDIGGNPASLIGDNASSFDFTVEIKASDVPGDYTYEALVTDANSKVGTSTVTITVESTPPTISYMGTNPLTIAPGLFGFNITATPGSGDLSTIAVYKDGALIDIDDMRFDGGAVDANPYTLPAAFATGLDMTSVGAVLTADGVYTFEVTDVNGQTASTTVDVTIESLMEYTNKLFYNKDGQSPGAFDLDSGEAQASSNNTETELQDQGLDSNDNWARKIEAENGAVLKAPDASSAELFNYDNVNTRDALIAGFDAGTDVSTGTDYIESGDVFICKQGDSYYLIQITSVVEDPDSNDDYYELSVKYSHN